MMKNTTVCRSLFKILSKNFHAVFTAAVRSGARLPADRGNFLNAIFSKSKRKPFSAVLRKEKSAANAALRTGLSVYCRRSKEEKAGTQKSAPFGTLCKAMCKKGKITPRLPPLPFSPASFWAFLRRRALQPRRRERLWPLPSPLRLWALPL